MGGNETYTSWWRTSPIQYVPVCNEGVGFSVCAGAWLGGKKPALIMENSGLRVASEYIARISLGTGVPCMLLLSYRGDVGETEHWGIPHGIVVEPLLQALRIPYLIVRPVVVGRSIKRAKRISEAQLHPAAVLVSGDCVWDDRVPSGSECRWPSNRYDWLGRLAAAVPEDALVMATYIGAVSFEWAHHTNEHPRTRPPRPDGRRDRHGRRTGAGVTPSQDRVPRR